MNESKTLNDDEEDEFQKKLQNSRFTLQNEGFINQNQGISQFENSAISLDIRNKMNKQGINYGNQAQGNPFLIEVTTKFKKIIIFLY